MEIPYNVAMNCKLIEQWILEHEPQGIEKLAVAAKISSETLKKAKLGSYKIKTKYKLKNLAKALGCTIEELLKTEEKSA